MTTHTVANPEYDPAEARRQAEEKVPDHPDENSDKEVESSPSLPPPSVALANASWYLETWYSEHWIPDDRQSFRKYSCASSSFAWCHHGIVVGRKDVTLDIRWTILLRLVSYSHCRQRLRCTFTSATGEHRPETWARWLDVVKFESRVTER